MPQHTGIITDEFGAEQRTPILRERLPRLAEIVGATADDVQSPTFTLSFPVVSPHAVENSTFINWRYCPLRFVTMVVSMMRMRYVGDRKGYLSEAQLL